MMWPGCFAQVVNKSLASCDQTTSEHVVRKIFSQTWPISEQVLNKMWVKVMSMLWTIYMQFASCYHAVTTILASYEEQGASKLWARRGQVLSKLWLRCEHVLSKLLPHSGPTCNFNLSWNLACLEHASWATKWLYYWGVIHHIACATLPPHSLRNPPHSLRNPPAAHLFFLLLGNLGSWNLVRCPNLQNKNIPKGLGHLCMQNLSWQLLTWGLRILPHSAPSWIFS